MSNGWTDRKNRTLINFLVNCPLGTMFIDSIDASSFMKSGEKTMELLDHFEEKIGEKNIVQVITDNGSNYVMAGRLLELKRKHLYWTPCAAHCIDLMLEDIGKIPRIKKTIERAVFLVGYIYNHTASLNLLRSFTKQWELVKQGITRFATSVLTLERIHEQKLNLRCMFTSDDWNKSKMARDAKGKRAAEIVLMPSFWNLMVYILKVMGPLVKVLRLVDNEKKPAMGYIYEAMDRAKETIMKSFDQKEDKYKEVFEIIDRRWECQLHHLLHVAGHYLNPEFFYGNPSVEHDEEVTNGLYKTIQRLVPEIALQDKIMNELSTYKKADGQFGNPMAIRTRTTKSPTEWWSLFGNSIPNFQQLAIKILSLTCSAAGCERNWSVFEQIHSKKRNRLEHQRLHDLVYIKYNQNLKARFEMRNLIDPISLHEIDDCNEWLVGEMGANVDNLALKYAENELVFENDDLTWGEVARAAGVGEKRNTRSQATKGSSSARASTFRPRIIDEESEEELEGYKSGDGVEASLNDENDDIMELDDF